MQKNYLLIISRFNVMNFKFVVQLVACTVIAALASLTTHIYIMKFVQPCIDSIMEQAARDGINFNTDPSTYSSLIIGAAYLTAIIMIAMYVFLYYQLQNLVPGKTVLKKILFVTLILFGIKGDLIRQPIMNFIVSYELVSFFSACKFVVLNHSDKWIANILLAICLVTLCPKKLKNG
jgi:hypothetical protein